MSNNPSHQIPHWKDRVKAGMLLGALYGPLGPLVTIPVAVFWPERLLVDLDEDQQKTLEDFA